MTSCADILHTSFGGIACVVNAAGTRRPESHMIEEKERQLRVDRRDGSIRLTCIRPSVVRRCRKVSV